MSTLEKIREILTNHATLAGDDDPLELDSFTLVVVTEELEQAFDLRVAARELTPENFGTIARMAAFVEGKTR